MPENRGQLSDRPERQTICDGEFAGVAACATGAEACANAARLADGLRARGIAHGRNPDGVNDDVDKALLIMDEWRDEATRLRAENVALTARLEEVVAPYRRLGHRSRQGAVQRAIDLLGELRGASDEEVAK